LSISSDKFSPILTGELSLRILRKTLATKLGFRPSLSKKELDNVLKTIKSALMILKYSYLQQEELANHKEIKNIEKLALILGNAFKPGKTTLSTVKISFLNLNWCVNTLRGLTRRMKITNMGLLQVLISMFYELEMYKNKANFF
jgi:predicted RNA-binding protein with EMAP domain